MRILFSLILAPLLCVPLMAMEGEKNPVQKTIGQKLSVMAGKARLEKIFATAREVHSAQDHIEEVAWNPQGTHLAVACENPFILDAQSESVSHIAGQRFTQAQQVAWNNSGRLLALVAGKQVIIFDTAKRVTTEISVPHKEESHTFASAGWSPTQENMLIRCSKDNIDTCVIAEDGSAHIVASCPTPQGGLFGLGMPVKVDWKRILALAYRGGIFFVNRESGFTQIPYCGNGKFAQGGAITHHPTKTVIACAFDVHPVGKKAEHDIVLCAQESNGELVPTKIAQLKVFIFDLSFSRDGRFLTAANDSCLKTFDGNTLEELHTRPLHKKFEHHSCVAAQWNPKNHQLAFADNEKLFITQEFKITEEK
jgi:WD40 repeat protein